MNFVLCKLRMINFFLINQKFFRKLLFSKIKVWVQQYMQNANVAIAHWSLWSFNILIYPASPQTFPQKITNNPVFCVAFNTKSDTTAIKIECSRIAIRVIIYSFRIKLKRPVWSINSNGYWTILFNHCSKIVFIAFGNVLMWWYWTNRRVLGKLAGSVNSCINIVRFKAELSLLLFDYVILCFSH